jgi:pre-mRNA-splicing factor CWC26
MSSKLDYLSKYMEKKPKKKKKKKKKTSVESSIRINDDEHGFQPGPIGSDDDDEEDGPTVVIPDRSTNLEASDHNSGTRYEQGRKDKPVIQKGSVSTGKNNMLPCYDSDSSRGQGRRGKRKRYDSDDDNDIDHGNTRKDSSDNVKSRKRYDSDDDNDEEVSNVRCKDEDTVHGKNDSRGNIQKQDSSRDHSRRGRFDSDDDESNDVPTNNDERGHQSKIRKMTSGHNAGLQSSTDFRKAEEMIQKSKAGKIKEMGRGETVYRNKDGQTISVDKASDVKSFKVSSPSWNLGTAQKQQMIDRLKEEQAVTSGAFSRSIMDVDRHRRHVVRQGDPMARQDTNNASKKSYKGPPPKPNRFGIPPGYRWDGFDRGNGFEDQVLATLYAKGRKKEESYKWSCADM